MDRREIKVVMVLQLHQLDSEVLQHAQEKAERFGSKANKLPRSAHRSEGDPFADTGPSGQYNDLPSDDELAGEIAGRREPPVMLLMFWCACNGKGLAGLCLEQGYSQEPLSSSLH